MLKYAVIGSGYRSEFFGRIARAYPEQFRAVYLCRSEEKTARITAHTGARAVTDPEEILRFAPDFVVVAVDRGHVAEETLKWADRGFPVVTETPSGDTEEKLVRLWEAAQRGAKIVCCEQYLRQPILAAGLRAVEKGLIGTPSSLYLSLLHHYHGASMIRHALGIRPGEGFTLRGSRTSSPVVATDSRESALLDGTVIQGERDRIHADFESGKQADYDFSSVQYRTYLRSRHLTLRGERGEWSDTVIRYLNREGVPEQKMLLPEIPEKYRCLDNQALRDRRRNWQSDLAPETVQDEFAIATLLYDMQDYLSGGPSPYPVEEALEDGYFWIQMEKAVADPWKPVQSERMPWHRTVPMTQFRDPY